MASINLTRLDQEIDKLATLVHEPQSFVEELHRLLSFYHRYAHREQTENAPIYFYKHYDLPEKVLPHIQARLKQVSKKEPEAVLSLVAELWQNPWYEARELAASMLGQLPIAQSEEVLTLIENWLAENFDQNLTEAILKHAPVTLIQNAPEEWKDLVHRFLNAPKIHSKRIGLLALAELIPEGGLDELPTYYRWVREFLISPDSSLDKALLAVIQALTQVSQQETAYLLREVLSDSNDASVGRRIRHYLGFFNEEQQARIMAAIKNQVIFPDK